MADETRWGDLFDRAWRVFYLAYDLGQAFSDERRRSNIGDVKNIGYVADWNQHAETFDRFCVAIEDIRDAIELPPEGFGSVADELKKAVRIASRISAGHAHADWFTFFPELKSVASGRLASDSRR